MEHTLPLFSSVALHEPVTPDIVDIPDFSVHSDADETLAWLSRAPDPPRAVVPVYGERVLLD